MITDNDESDKEYDINIKGVIKAREPIEESKA